MEEFLAPIVNYFRQLKNLELFVELNEVSILKFLGSVASCDFKSIISFFRLLFRKVFNSPSVNYLL